MNKIKSFVIIAPKGVFMDNIELKEINTTIDNNSKLKTTTIVFSENEHKKEIVFEGNGELKLAVKA